MRLGVVTEVEVYPYAKHGSMISINLLRIWAKPLKVSLWIVSTLIKDTRQIIADGLPLNSKPTTREETNA
jgi:hypothetical protein